MNKQGFLDHIRKGISGLPQNEIEERIAFYGEMIDDRIDDGFSEEDAVADIGRPDEIIARIISEIPLTRLVKEKVGAKNNFKAWEIVLLAAGAPIWASLLIAAFAIVFSLYISAWSIIVSFWAGFGSLVGCTFGGIVAGVIFFATGKAVSGTALLSCGLVCAGLSIFAFYGCKAATDGILVLTKKAVFSLKKRFIKKEEA